MKITVACLCTFISIVLFETLQMLGTPENKPPFLSDKQLEPALKFLHRKFPMIDSKTNAVNTSLSHNSLADKSSRVD